MQYVKLEDVLDYEQPTKYIVSTENYSDGYKTPVLTAGKSFILGYTDEINGIFKGTNESVIIFDDFTRDTKYVDFDFKVKSSAMKILHKKNKDDSLKYIFYAINKIDFVPFSHKRLWISEFSQFQIPLPPKDQQQKIAAHLDKITQGINNKKKQLALFDELVKSKFAEMFGDPVTNEMGWECKKLGEIILNANNGMARRGNDEGGNIVLRLVELQDGYIDYSYPNRIILNDSEKERYLLRNNDILFARVNGNPNNVGRCAVFNNLGEDVFHNDHIIRVHLDEEKVNATFAVHFLNGDFGKKQIRNSVKTSAGQYTINREGISTVEFPLPPLPLQNQFATFVQKCYRKYKAIFNYFDSMLLGLTATPKEFLDSYGTTYDLFDLPQGEPTYNYDFKTAVDEGFLVNYFLYDKTTQILKDGLTYASLSEAEKREYEKHFLDENGYLPPKIDHKKFYQQITNLPTVDLVLQTLMSFGMKTKGGEEIGKSIIFAQDHDHAQLIVDRFKVLYPGKGDDYCKLIDNRVKYADTIIDAFKVKDKEPVIAVSVDMLDTGIDVPEIVNLVFFKKLFSEIKFWQMIGRGTRTCKDLNVNSPDKSFFNHKDGEEFSLQVSHQKDKQGFYIFDFCNVFEFFDANPQGKEPVNVLSLSQNIFNIKIDITAELQKFEHQENAEHKAYYEKTKKRTDRNRKRLEPPLDKCSHKH